MQPPALDGSRTKQKAPPSRCPGCRAPKWQGRLTHQPLKVLGAVASVMRTDHEPTPDVYSAAALERVRRTDEGLLRLRSAVHADRGRAGMVRLGFLVEPSSLCVSQRKASRCRAGVSRAGVGGGFSVPRGRIRPWVSIAAARDSVRSSLEDRSCGATADSQPYAGVQRAYAVGRSWMDAVGLLRCVRLSLISWCEWSITSAISRARRRSRSITSAESLMSRRLSSSSRSSSIWPGLKQAVCRTTERPARRRERAEAEVGSIDATRRAPTTCSSRRKLEPLGRAGP